MLRLAGAEAQPGHVESARGAGGGDTAAVVGALLDQVSSPPLHQHGHSCLLRRSIDGTAYDAFPVVGLGDLPCPKR